MSVDRDYIILDSEDRDELRKMVLEKMEEYYMTAGGLQIVHLPGARYLTFFQAMYRIYKPEEEDEI